MTEPVAGAASQAPAGAGTPGNTGAAPAAAQQPAAGQQPANNQQPQNILADAKPAGEQQPAAGAEGQQPGADGNKPPEPTAEEQAQIAEQAKAIDNLKLPDGLEAGELFDNFKNIAKELKLPPEKAQELTELGAKLSEEIHTKTRQGWIDLNKQWEAEVKADPVIGGKNFDKMVSTVTKALDTYGDAKTREALIMTGAGNNPAIIKLLYGMSQALTEAGGMVGGGVTQAPKTVGQTLYPNMKSST